MHGFPTRGGDHSAQHPAPWIQGRSLRGGHYLLVTCTVIWPCCQHHHDLLITGDIFWTIICHYMSLLSNQHSFCTRQSYRILLVMTPLFGVGFDIVGEPLQEFRGLIHISTASTPVFVHMTIISAIMESQNQPSQSVGLYTVLVCWLYHPCQPKLIEPSWTTPHTCWIHWTDMKHEELLLAIWYDFPVSQSGNPWLNVLGLNTSRL